mmetsp:Transcript_9333/g.12890  ORF Transcript_9333/g.12890 Transcript_9333/m.12890 type:complete len:86 (+) Transcript_9333:307-564(+)
MLYQKGDVHSAIQQALRPDGSGGSKSREVFRNSQGLYVLPQPVPHRRGRAAVQHTCVPASACLPLVTCLATSASLMACVVSRTSK